MNATECVAAPSPSKHVGELRWPFLYDPPVELTLITKLGTICRQKEKDRTQSSSLPLAGMFLLLVVFQCHYYKNADLFVCSQLLW